MTPVGNPQNLYLYSVSGMDMGQFFVDHGSTQCSLFLMILGACMLHKNLYTGCQVPESRNGLF